MTATAFIALAQNALSKFTHAVDCSNEPEVVTHPVTGAIGIACKGCKRLIVISKVDKAGTSDNSTLPSTTEQPRPRFKI